MAAPNDNELTTGQGSLTVVSSTSSTDTSTTRRKSFLERYYDSITRNLGDTNASTRYPKSARLDDLHEIDREVYENLLTITKQESILGYAEARIDITNGQDFYLFPPGFRQFYALERRSSDGKSISATLSTRPLYGSGYRIQILTAERGFRLFPAPTISDDEEWVLRYSRAPGFLHYARAKDVSDLSVVGGTPPTDGGELIRVRNYYNGMMLRIFSASQGAPQSREVVGYNADTGTFTLRHAFQPKPTGEVWYELLPTLPEPYDSFYSLDASILELDRREKPEKAASLLKQRAKKWKSAALYIMSNTSDREPGRTRPPKARDRITYGEIPTFLPTGRIL